MGMKLRDCGVLVSFPVLMTRTRPSVNGTPEMMNLGRRMVSRLILHVRVDFFVGLAAQKIQLCKIAR